MSYQYEPRWTTIWEPSDDKGMIQVAKVKNDYIMRWCIAGERWQTATIGVTTERISAFIEHMARAFGFGFVIHRPDGSRTTSVPTTRDVSERND